MNSVELVNPSLGVSEASALRNYSSTLFALDLAGILLILASFAQVLSIEEKRLVAPELAADFRNGRNRMLILSVLMIISIAPQFWSWALFGIPVRLYIWYLPLISYWGRRAIQAERREQGMRALSKDRQSIAS